MGVETDLTVTHWNDRYIPWINVVTIFYSSYANPFKVLSSSFFPSLISYSGEIIENVCFISMENLYDLIFIINGIHGRENRLRQF